jgi:hypothetical protein
VPDVSGKAREFGKSTRHPTRSSKKQEVSRTLLLPTPFSVPRKCPIFTAEVFFLFIFEIEFQARAATGVPLFRKAEINGGPRLDQEVYPNCTSGNGTESEKVGRMLGSGFLPSEELSLLY